MKLAELVSVFFREDKCKFALFSETINDYVRIVDISWYWACAVQHICLLFAVWHVNGELNM